MTRRDFRMILIGWIACNLFTACLYALWPPSHYKVDCGPLSLEEVQAAGVNPGDCAVMPKNRNGG